MHMIKMNIIIIVLRMSGVCIQYVFVENIALWITSKDWLSPLVILTLSFVPCHYTLNSTFLFSVSHLYLSLGSYPRSLNPDLWISFLPTTLFMGGNTLLYMSINVLSRVLRWPEHPQEQLKLWELPNVEFLWKSG